MVINHIIGIGFGADTAKLREAVEKFGLMDDTSDSEREMLTRDEHSEHEKINAQWLVEAMQSFAWCLGLIELD